MKKTVLFLLVCLIGGNAIAQVKTAAAKSPSAKVVEQQTKLKDKIVEDGVEYYRVKTLDDMKQIGFTISKDKSNRIMAASRGHRGGRLSCCNFNGGHCSSLLIVNNGEITSANYVEEEGPDGKIIKTKDNLMPYYNGKVNKNVLFR
jgi:hypothetical protein